MNNSLPICLYPTRKIVIDDDSIFSDSILLTLNGNNFISYNSPKKALNYFLHEYQPTLTKADLISKNSEILDSSTQHTINIDIEKLKKMLTNHSPTDISVLLIDYHMPEMKGIDLLNEIRHLPIKKVLITGEHDYKIGVDAFNSNLVDAYLRKDDPDLSKKLKLITSELGWKYFTELSSLITDIPSFNYLKNIHLVKAFKEFVRENDITAFCLTHIDGNFLTYNANGEMKHVLIRSKAQLDDLATIAEEDGGSSQLIEQLKQRKMIPFFDSFEYWQVPACEWSRFLFPAADIPGDSNLVWAIINI